MEFLRKTTLFMGLIAILAITGCGSAETPVSLDDDDLLDELLDPETDSERDPIKGVKPVARTAMASGEKRQEPAEPVEHGRTNLQQARGERLELRLHQGDRFPLLKTIEQSLEQSSEVAPAKARTRLEMAMAITVEEVKPDAVLLGVRYSRVAYEHDVNGQHLSYDSESHQGAVPWDAVPYAGMIGNGFSFWLGRDNRIRELVGYQAFLERCVAEIPLERRQTMMSEISNRFGDDGVANFIDDSIGLLPFDATVDAEAATRVLPGDTWTRERRLMQPVPIYLTSTYRLTEINDSRAEIEINGRVAAGDAGSAGEHGRLRITGGQSVGHCSVDRLTGLPLEMNLTRYMTMKLTTSDNQEVTQHKTIQTSIRTFPEMRGSVAGSSPQPGIRQASSTSFPSAQNQNVAAPGTAAGPSVRAVYPK